MSNKLILVEHISPADSDIILESHGEDNKDFYLKGVFAQAEIRNRNKRRYPLDEMVSAVNTFNEQIKNSGGVFGELDHPENRLTIALDRVSHVITKLQMDGNNVIGEATILDTPMGTILKNLYKSKTVKPGVSTRGAGNLNENMDVSGFTLYTIDAVATPSAQGANPMLVYEQLETTQGKKLITLAESMREDAKAQKYFNDEIFKFISRLVNK